ncbi:MAG TPA: hypothetical protein VF406_06765 [Thermodesulfobacteriota bacterium]
MPTALSLDRRLAEMGADLDLLRWIRVHHDLPSAWAACPRGDWLLWIAAILARRPEEQRAVVLAAAACARLALPYAIRQVPGPETAIEAAEGWGRSLASGGVVDAAAKGAAFTVMASLRDERAWAAASAAWASAWAAVWFAYQDGHSVGAAQAARQAAEASAEAHGAAATAVLARCADIVRAGVACPTMPAATATAGDAAS